MGKFGFERTIGDLLQAPEAVAVFEEVCPELIKHPALKFVKKAQLGEMLAKVDKISEETKQELKTRLEAL